jgi:hypothetical protein
MKQPKDIFNNPIPVLSLGIATDVTDSIYATDSVGIVRVTAIGNVRVWYHPKYSTAVGDGLYLPETSCIEIATDPDYVIQVTGAANITKLY